MLLRLLHIGIAALCWIILAVKAADLVRRPRNRGLRSLVVICLGLSVALTVGIPPVYAAIDRLTHVPNVAKLIQHLATLGAAGAISVMLVGLDRERPGGGGRARRRIALACAAAGAMTVLFVLAPVDVSEPILFADRYSTAALVPEYMLVFIAMTALACVDIAISTWRYGRQRRHTASRALRLSVRLVSAAALFGLAYCLYKALYVAIRLLGLSPPGGENAVSTPLALTAVILGATGLALPKLGAAAEALHRRLGCLRAYRRLRPLWADLHAAMPEIALHRPRTREPLVILDIEYRLYRRVIEINDGMLALDVAGLVPHGEPDPRAAAAAASALAHALQKRDGRPAAGDAAQPAGQPERSLDDEVRWLVMVADAYRP
ncbi:MAB_1171c family putative transporter [Nonomuraea sp. NPDC050643]|uniref:MAB_1171c family putative transporter n=1 Tax=Nonomuraea sp. NPDC050643 TaxID=3155660 RepID=UPI0034059FE5